MGGEVAVADEAGEVGGVGFVGARGFVADGVRSSKEAREVGRHCGGGGRIFLGGLLGFLRGCFGWIWVACL